MDSFGLIDLGFKGPTFTWSNNRTGRANIRERLDRAIANFDWQALFLCCHITHLLWASSDHAPLLIESDGDTFSYLKPFRFEPMWIKDETCGRVILDSWHFSCRGSPSFIFYSKFKAVKQAFKLWNRNHFGLVKERITALAAHIQSMQALPPFSRQCCSWKNVGGFLAWKGKTWGGIVEN